MKCKCDDCAVKHICAKKKGVKEISAALGLWQVKVIAGPSLLVAYASSASCESERTEKEQLDLSECQCMQCDVSVETGTSWRKFGATFTHLDKSA